MVVVAGSAWGCAVVVGSLTPIAVVAGAFDCARAAPVPRSVLPAGRAGAVGLHRAPHPIRPGLHVV